jgi:hypothetical protein
MTEYGTKIETILTTSTNNFADRVLHYGQSTEKKEKVDPSHFLKFLFANRTNGTLAFAPPHNAYPSAKAKEPFFFNAFFGGSKIISNFVNLFR